MNLMKLSVGSVLLVALASSAFAELYEIRAVGATTPSGDGTSFVTTSDWSVIFNDTGDQLLQVSEIVSFSGATVTTSSGGPYVYDTVVGSPEVSGISTQSGGLNACCWWFTGPVIAETDQDGWRADRWSAYQIELAVVSPKDLLEDLIAAVIALNINAGISNGLDRKLQNALDALDRVQSGDVPAAVGILTAFIQSVEAQRGRSLTSEQADEIISAAERIVDVLENR